MADEPKKNDTVASGSGKIQSGRLSESRAKTIPPKPAPTIVRKSQSEGPKSDGRSEKK